MDVELTSAPPDLFKKSGHQPRSSPVSFFRLLKLTDRSFRCGGEDEQLANICGKPKPALPDQLVSFQVFLIELTDRSCRSGGDGEQLTYAPD